jgi:phage terminase small subunit
MNVRKLDARKEKFCQAYLIDYNATKAAIAAGYGKKSAYKAGYRLSSNVQVQKRLAELQQKQCDRYEITAERIKRELALLAYANMDDYVDIQDGKRVLNTAKPNFWHGLKDNQNN